ncbi:MAG: isoprenylcysteine carboxylmethyltransferase family protein [Acidobacteriota bacterium]
MSAAAAIAWLTLGAVLLVMLGEAALSAHNEAVLRQRGAVEPSGDVYSSMRWAYPASFVAMALEGSMTGPTTPEGLALGLAAFACSKALKIWAISSLGVRWTFRVLVLPDAPLVSKGPYAFLRHPNYVAVMGELAGVAAIVWAPVTGLVALAGVGELLRRRIAVENRALGRQ